MILDLSRELDVQRGRTYLESLIKKQAKAELCHKRNKRTLSQNSLLWLWLGCISHETGNNKDYLHEYFKQKFLGKENITVLENDLQVTVSTTKLDTAQMKAYLNSIQEFANTELGILLPNPEDLVFNEFYDRYENFI
jgi:hypothetical protein